MADCGLGCHRLAAARCWLILWGSITGLGLAGLAGWDHR